MKPEEIQVTFAMNIENVDAMSVGILLRDLARDFLRRVLRAHAVARFSKSVPARSKTIGSHLNKTIIPLALVGYEMIVANSALRNATRLVGTIVKHQARAPTRARRTIFKHQATEIGPSERSNATKLAVSL